MDSKATSRCLCGKPIRPSRKNCRQCGVLSRKPASDWEIYEDEHGKYMRIALTQGQYALVDEWDFGRLNAFNWNAHFAPSTQTFYAVRKTPRPEGLQTDVQMHRTIGLNGAQKDHADGNTLNNREYNLRQASHSDNACNRKTRKNSKTGFKGVTWKLGRCEVRITIKGKTIHLGTAATPREGAVIYNAAAIEYHGEFARLNVL